MAYILRGFFIAIFFIFAFTLILALMLQPLIEESSKMKCDYQCCIQKLFGSYDSFSFLILFVAFWILGSRIAKLSYLIGKEKSINRKSSGEYKWLWEHKLSVVEDKE